MGMKSRVRRDVPANRLDGSRSVPADGKRKGVVDESVGCEGKPVDKGIPARESDTAVRRRREAEKTNDVRPRGGCFENNPRVATNIVVILGQYEAVGRNDLEDGVHRRAELSLRLQVGNERLPAGQIDCETVHIARCGEATIHCGRSDAEALRCLGVIVGLDFENLGEHPDDERTERGRPLLIVEPHPAQARRGIGRQRRP